MAAETKMSQAHVGFAVTNPAVVVTTPAAVQEAYLPPTTIQHVAGLSYLPDNIEAAENKWLISKLNHELLDFVTILTQLLDLMHLLKAQDLRTDVSLPHPVIRELSATKKRGPLMRNFLRELKMRQMTSTPSVDAALGYHMLQLGPRRFPNKADPATNPKTFPFANDLLELSGRKSRPLWQAVVLEKSEDAAILSKIKKDRDSARSSNPLTCQKNQRARRTKLETTMFSIQFLLKEVQAEMAPKMDEKIHHQMEMMLASHAGFRTVEDHQAYLATLESHWFKNYIQDVCKLGVASCRQLNEAFGRLARHYSMNFNTLPFAKAKLCLIVLSLPYCDIARVTTQRAVEFILEQILLLTEEKPLHDWLTARSIHYVVIPAFSSEDFEFSDSQQAAGEEGEDKEHVKVKDSLINAQTQDTTANTS